jgi:hypothetical protein
MKLARSGQGTKHRSTGLLLIVLLLHNDVVALTLHTSRGAAELVQASSTELKLAEAHGVNVANNSTALPEDAAAFLEIQRHKTATSNKLAGRRKLQYLLASQEHQRLGRSGVSCPPPQPCECHCDCPSTKIGKPLPNPTPCPVYPNVWPSTPAPPTKPPTTTGPPTTTPAALVVPKECKKYYVRMSDGTCMKITYKTILRLEKMVEDQKKVLDGKLLEMSMVAEPNCTQCPGAKEYFALRPVVEHEHQKYLYVLRMFMGALAMFEEEVKEKKEEAAVAEAAGEDPRGDEFILGSKSYRPHCEPWTRIGNEPIGVPTKNFCAILCRQMPACVGFGWDPKAEWCLWYDDAKPEPEDKCTTATKTDYIKNWQGPINENLWIAVDKVRVFDGALQNALDVAKLQAHTADKFFKMWKGEVNKDKDEANSTLASIHMANLSDSTNHYGGTIYDTKNLVEHLAELKKSAFQMTVEEISKRPAFNKKPPPPKKIVKAKEVIIPEGLEEPLSDAPKILEWHDFPNSQDTKWSQQHPDCPMGTPCFCDCKCRGAPPQNFVEPPPPPYPPPPCPPPPIPPPAGMLSDLASAQMNR